MNLTTKRGDYTTIDGTTKIFEERRSGLIDESFIHSNTCLFFNRAFPQG